MEITVDEFIRGLMGLAEVGIVNHREDTRLIRDAALLIDFQRRKIEQMKEEAYQLEERIAIMEEGNQITIVPGANVDLTAILDSIDKVTSGLIEEE